ncbi:CehA/McbA family metallohydrolase [Phytoactinopolyspora mesophila]|uniref:PHP domain-containing protein n=1 Tax=Phytoactinopolyspora mesophila TaxID=2650750 RepID=A0A7K3M3B2_9ACTN|nr:CehA/McbA family metallohydrolase [Phytoactinopolyspora mesophila]NDL56938.1 PHP domain-containing protein [Phytoactinopolyspora mesophila]
MRITRTLTPEDRAASPYLELPFEVPAGTPSIEVRLSYDRGQGVIDLGCLGADGFRGWSGGARSRYVIAAGSATPGYLPGEIESGVWAVLLGLHRVPAAGVDVVVEVDMPATGPAESEPTAPPVPERRPRRTLPADTGRTWLACDFHAHTLHSDGSFGRAELAAAAVEAGLDVLAVTDHNTVSHFAGLERIGSHYGTTLVPGQEVTTDRGHANAFGAIPWVDFRQPAESWVSHVESAGGLLSINHPLMGDFAWSHPLKTRPPLAEIWHGSWLDTRWTGPLAWWNAWGWDTVPISGSDFHNPEDGRPLAVPVTWVAVESDLGPAEPASAAAVIDGLRHGRVAVTSAVDAPVLLRADGELVAVGADGTLLTDRYGNRRPVHGDLARFRAADGPYRLETPDAAVVAITP